MYWQRENDAAGAHTQLVYRVVEGVKTAVIPASCKRRLHTLDVDGYRVTTVDNSNGAAVDELRLLQVSCMACAAKPDPDHFWNLGFTGAAPERVELDDEPNWGVEPSLIVRVVEPFEAGSAR